MYAYSSDTITHASDVADTVDMPPKPAYVALKNNLLYDAIATPNLQLEVRLADHWSLQAGVGFNPFPLDDTKFPKWRHVYAELAPRYWFCETFTRDFVSLNVGYTHYNVAGGMYPIGWMYKPVRTNRFQGDAVLFGASYGWQFALSPHFSIELEGGVDAGITWFDKYECVHCGKMLAERERKWFALPRLGVNLVVLLDGNNDEFEDRCDCSKLSRRESAEEQDTVLTNETEQIKPDTVPVPQIEPQPEVIEPQPEETEQRSEAVEQAPVEEVPEAEVAHEENPHDSVPETVIALAEKQEELPHSDQMVRLKAAILRPVSEFEPYDPQAVISHEPNSVFMHFDVNVTNLDRNFIHNDQLMDSIMHVIADAVADTTIEIKIIKIVGMASFDGSLSGNIRLAKSRADALKDYIQSNFGFGDDLFRVYNGGESWAELRWYLSQEEFDGKQDILNIIDLVPDYDMRERLIKQHNNGQTYKYMRTHFKRHLRNLGTIVVYYLDKK